MSYELSKDILEYLKQSEEETINLIETLCGIPAPSHHEERRAEFVKNWLTENGAKGVYIDEALNVLYPVGVKVKMILWCSWLTQILFFRTWSRCRL